MSPYQLAIKKPKKLWGRFFSRFSFNTKADDRRGEILGKETKIENEKSIFQSKIQWVPFSLLLFVDLFALYPL